MYRYYSLNFDKQMDKPYSSYNEYLGELAAFIKSLLDNYDGKERHMAEFSEYFSKKQLCSSQKGIFFPLEYLRKSFGFTNELVQIFLLSIGCIEDTELVDLVKEKSAGIGDADFLASLFALDNICEVENALKFAEESDLFVRSIGQGGVFRLREPVECFLTGKEYINSEIAKLYAPNDLQINLLCHNDIQDKLANLIEIAYSDDSYRYFAFITGDNKAGKKTQIMHLSNTKGFVCFFINMPELLWAYRENFRSVFEDLLIYCALFDAVPVFTYAECMESAGVEFLKRIPFNRYFEMFKTVFFLSAQELEMETPENSVAVHIPIPLPDRIVSQKLWRHFGDNINGNIQWELYANKFKFTIGLIKRTALNAEKSATLKGKAFADDEDITQSAYALIRHKLGKRAVKSGAKYIFEDLVLPDYQLSMLITACNQLVNKHIVYDMWGFGDKIHYGKGLSMLFSGPPGTGKTMAAQVVASHLNMELYVVNLSMIVSKYIGETEKNINELFDEAKKSHSIVFFDEADALFSKRTEVKSSNDKASNMEASYLLQKMEEYDGIIILCTNFVQNFDEAFKRRLMFVIDFPFPQEVYRRKIWEKIYPGGAPLCDDIDFEFLAEKFELSGANIKNIAVNSAFLAASAGSDISMKEILVAIRSEFAKIGKTMTREDFGQYYMLLE